VTAPPLFVLGVRRSGTTLLRGMLDRHSELSIPDESYFIPQLADRHRGRIDRDAFLDDLRRLPTLGEWEVEIADVQARLTPNMELGEAIAAVYLAYAGRFGKPRWGDKTPMYMQHLRTLERLYPDGRYVHLIRDGRDAAVSFLQMPAGIVTRTWAHPGDAAGFACQWRSEVLAAKALGRRAGERYVEVRYEQLVADPERELRKISTHAGLPFEKAMLDHAGSVDVSAKPHQQSLSKPLTPGLRDWRTEMSADEILAFEGVAGDLLAGLGYPVTRAPTVAGRVRRVSYAGRVFAWTEMSRALRRSPLWRRRHPPL
jgi:Sulfotransferase family